MTATPGMTIRDLVATDYRTAAVFERYGLDFCCSGGRTVAQSCSEARIDLDALLHELDAVLTAPATGVPPFAEWDARALIDYIVSTHHVYVRQAMPALLQHTQKIADVHGARHTEWPHIARLFRRVAAEMTTHMEKEELVLFPFIQTLESAVKQGAPVPVCPFGSLRHPIQAMETEHDFAGDAMAEIRELTGGYRAPDDACGTYRVCLQELAAFQRDLHAHVHLENNILFPKALALESR
jgi:regulator of cell morphogenesis and NO signaling